MGVKSYLKLWIVATNVCLNQYSRVLAQLVASFENKSGIRDLLISNVVFPRTGCYLEKKSFLKKDHEVVAKTTFPSQSPMKLLQKPEKWFRNAIVVTTVWRERRSRHREDWAPQGNNNHRIQPKARIEYFQEPMVSPWRPFWRERWSCHRDARRMLYCEIWVSGKKKIIKKFPIFVKKIIFLPFFVQFIIAL